MKSTLKRIAPVLWLTALLSCQQVPNDSLESRAMATINIQATTLGKNEIGEWEDTGSSDITINGTETDSRAATEYVTRMAFFLVDEDGNQVLTQEKGSNEDGFMNLYAELPVGTYKLIVFGHNGTSSVSLSEDKTITPNGKTTDSFHYYQEITLDEDTPNDQSITLDRCVAKFSIKHTDAIPADASSVELNIIGASNTLDALTGLAPSAAEQSVSISIPASAEGSKGNTFSIFTFLTAEKSSVDITATAKDSDGNPITSYTFEDVPVEINMQTIYTGAFFHSDRQVSVSINNEWKADKNIAF